jgi:hypothetical protein
MNKSTITNYTPDGQWRDMYKFKVTLQDGTEGTAFAKSENFRFQVGEEVEYVVNEKGNLRLNKQQFFGNSVGASAPASYEKKEVPNYTPSSQAIFSKDELIIRQVALKAAVDYGKESGLDYQQVLAAAEIFNGWILGKTGPAQQDPF